MPRSDAVKTCAICGSDLDRDDYARIIIQQVRLYPRGTRYWKQKTTGLMPQTKVCKNCYSKAVAAIKTMGVKNG